MSATHRSLRFVNPALGREKVTGAPFLRIPNHPHQLVGVIGSQVVVSDAEVQVA